MTKPTDEMRAAFLAENEDTCDAVGCGRPECLDQRLTAVLAIVERDYQIAGPCSSTLAPIVGIVPTWCQLRHGHTGDHESGPTRWREQP